MDALDSGSSNTTEDEFIAEEKVPSTTKSARTIGKLVEVDQKKVVDEEFRLRVEKSPAVASALPDNWYDLTVREQRDWVYREMRDCKKMPDSLIRLCVGSTVSGECEAESRSAPDWLDREKFQRGQRFAMKHCAGVMLAEMLSLFAIFSFGHGLKPLIGTDKSREPFTAFKRYLSTVKRVRNWYTSDVWTEGTDAQKDVHAVRKMHASVRRKFNVSNFATINELATIPSTWSNSRTKIGEDFRDTCPVPAPGQCPYMFFSEDDTMRPSFLNQGDMSFTQFGFMALVILYPRSFGIHNASDEDLDAFCHVWRGLGYLLGIEDEFNFCDGTLDEVKQRSRDFLEYWIKPNLREITPEWEHMTRCVVEGIKFYSPTVSYEQLLLYFADTIEIPMPRVRSSISYITWFRLNAMKYTLHWTARWPRLLASINRRFMMRIDKALEYTDDELQVLREESEIAFSKGIAETMAIRNKDAAMAAENKDAAMAAPIAWPKAPFVVLSAVIILSFRSIVKDKAK